MREREDEGARGIGAHRCERLEERVKGATTIRREQQGQIEKTERKDGEKREGGFVTEAMEATAGLERRDEAE